MSGILDKKQRIMDFSLTRNGYEQIQNGDLRIKYATFNDKSAIYEEKENEIATADLNIMPFFFESFNTDLDIINHEIELKNTIYSTDLSNNIKITTDVENENVTIQNGKIVTSSSNIQLVFDSLKNISNNAFQKHSTLLSDNLINYNLQKNENNEISLYINKVNNNKVDNNISINNTFSLEINRPYNDYTTFVNQKIYLDDKSLIEDSRFIDKIPFTFLPPSTMNVTTISKDNNLLKFYNLAIDPREKRKKIYKNLKNNETLNISDIIGLKDLSTNEILNSIYNLELLSNKQINVNKNNQNITIENTKYIKSFELNFEKNEYDCPFLIQMFEENSTTNEFYKLIMIDHGETFDKVKQKNIQVYSVGKLFFSKTDVGISILSQEDEESSTSRILNYNNDNNYLFINLFTIVVE